MKCMVANCNSSNDGKASDCSFFSFPTNPGLIKKWIQFCRHRNAFNPKTSFICMKHFRTEDIQNCFEYEMGFAEKRLLRRGVVPTIYRKKQENTICNERLQRRKNKSIVSKLLEENSAPRSFEVVNVTTENVDYIATANCTFEANVSLVADRLKEASPSQAKVFDNTNHMSEIRDLHVKLKTLHCENLELRKENRKHRSELKALKCNLHLKEIQMGLLGKRAMKAEKECTNIENKLKEILENT